MKITLAYLCALLAMLLVAPANATSTLSYEGGGYSMIFEIGHTDRPVIASIHFYEPGDSKGVVLRSGFQVKTFDTRRKELLLVYTGHDTRVPPFTLVAHAGTSMLSVHGKRIRSTFSWEM